jgi:hypothetical protein
MEGYKDEENNRKAGEVRKLVLQAERNLNVNYDQSLMEMQQADQLSIELAKYLKNRVIFGKRLFKLPELSIDEYKNIRNFRTNEQFSEYITNTIKNFPLKEILKEIHSIGVIYTWNNGVESSFPIISYFVDEGGIHFTYNSVSFSQLIMPPEFYDFLEKMGLTINAATIAYRMDLNSVEGTKWEELPNFGLRRGSWPMVIKEKEKI